jgi:hypothetical protein
MLNKVKSRMAVRRFALSFIFFGAFFQGKSQTAKDSIANTISTFFKGMSLIDTNLIKSTLTSTCNLQTIVNKKGAILVMNEGVEKFLNAVAAGKPGEFDERYKIKSSINDEYLATTWVPYEFYYKGKYSHKGNNIFILVKQNNIWLINYVIDTRKK